MTIKKATEILMLHSRWRKGDDTIKMTNPIELGNAIDTIVKFLNKEKKTFCKSK